AQGAPLSAAQLRAGLARRLPEYMVPSVFVGLATLPLNASGKVDRRALPAPDEDSGGSEAVYEAPRDERERELAKIWRTLLGRDRIGVHEPFFEIGGHSLLATQLVSRIRDVFGVELPLRSVFLMPTIAQQAQALSQVQAPDGGRIERAERTLPYQPTSFAQRRLWFLEQLNPGGAAYNMSTALRLQGRLDEAALQRALDALVERHEVLRTTFALEEGEPVQWIAQQGEARLSRMDLTGEPPQRREALLREHAWQQSSKGFDLARGPLLRAELIRLQEQEHVLLLTLHHIVSDGWSLGVMARELSALYGAEVSGREAGLGPLAIQYADFAHWQRGRAGGEALERQIGYWKAQLAGAPQSLNLPVDFARPAVATQRGALHGFELKAELARAVSAFSQRHGVTVFMTLLAAFKLVLWRYSGQGDVVVGVPVANRNRTEVEGLLGCFVNTLALRTRVRGEETVLQLLERVKEATLGGYANQEAPFEQVVEAVQGARQLSHTPLFQVMFVLQNAPQGALELPGLKVKEERYGHGTSKFDLSLVLEQDEQGHVKGGVIEYSTDLYLEQTVSRLRGHWERAIEALVAQPQQRVETVSLLSGQERAQLGRWNETAVGFEATCVQERIAKQARMTPEAVALVFGDERI
ncbi:non-ribosomal peptide synthetase, partial [bacterium M00.F.Ca.ET.228.01.1.1]|uniref:condensation domain-containing protein n=2 Tax=Paraburkholderia phenoliruptrix TaxID=252970 RepID=UPI001137A001